MRIYLNIILIALLVFSCRTEPKETESKVSGNSPETINLRLINDPDGLSPILARSKDARSIFRHLYVRLLEVNPITLETEPFLANGASEISTLDNGGKQFTYTIRKDATWSDGSQITANDLLFSYKMIKHPGVKTRYGVISDLVGDIKIYPDNPKKISFLTDECHITLEPSICELFVYPEMMYDPDLAMRSIPFSTFKNKELLDQTIKENSLLSKVAERVMDPEYSRDTSKIISAGAYKLKEWLTGQRVVLEKNKDWWGFNYQGDLFTKNTDNLVYNIIPDNTTALTQLINGELDALSNIAAPLFDEYKNKEQVNAFTPDAFQIVWLTLNNNKGLLADKNIRKALTHVCDIPSIIKNGRNGYASPVNGPYMASAPYYDKSLNTPKFDIEKAKALLKASGWKDKDGDGIVEKIIEGKNTSLTLEFTASTKSTTGPIVAEILKNSAKKAGINIKYTGKDTKVYRQELIKGDFDMVITGSSFDSGLYDPKGRWHTESFPPNGGNYPRFGNTKTDALIDQIRVECEDSDLRTSLYKQFHKAVVDEQPVVFLYSPQELILVNSAYDNVVASSLRPGFFEEFLTLK